MQVTSSVNINAPKEAVWKVVTDIDNSANNISGIDAIEVLERNGDEFVGLKWRETRTMFGREAVEVMWITDAVENKSYEVRAENHGALYETFFNIAESNGISTLTMRFKGTPQTTTAKIMSSLMGWMMKGSMEKAISQDLEDIKLAVEGGGNAGI